MKKPLALLLVTGLLMTLCACGTQPPQESGSTLNGAVSTTRTTAAQDGTPSADDVPTDTEGTSSGTTTVEGDTAAPVEDTTTRTERPTAAPSSDGNPSVTTTTLTAKKTTTTTTTQKITTTTTQKITTTTVAPSPLLQGDLVSKRLKVGDRMYDGTFTDTAGNTITLSSLLRDKEMVVLNYWFINCPWCVKEFPAMSEAYGEYKDRVAVYALNPIDGAAAITQFRADNAGLQFPMATCAYEWAQAFRITGYPTTVVIDRDGVIRKIHTGAMVEKSQWIDLFESYL